VKRGVLLEQLTWVEAEAVLTDKSVVVIPLGAASKEHGPHLKLNNDWLIAEYVKQCVLDRADAVVAPTVSYSFYPAFVEYPGSISISQETSTRLLIDICRSLAAFGPRRFYVINTGISTIKALEPAAHDLAGDGILLTYTNYEQVIAPTVLEVSEQEGGTHADEIETSIMLYIAPDSVDMSKAVKDFDKTGKGRLSRSRAAGLTYSPSGIWGDASLATVDKGKRVVQSLIDGVLHDIEVLRDASLPPVLSSAE
jgi:creatinine amidohydrolase